MDEILNEINNDSGKNGIFLSLSGPLSQNLMVEIGEVLKQKMKLEGAEMSTILKVFSILVELNQNINYYSVERIRDGRANTVRANDTRQNTGCGIIAIGQKKGRYYVMSGNLIEDDKVEKLRHKLDMLTSMNHEELKTVYREQRRLGPDEDSKGAGLGLIEVARKVSKPLVFDFVKAEKEFTFFTLKTTV
ncbi:MAG: hypothetical protein GY866_38560 [Proteobacteria bacterium]|nr:hypothetical protein [Pseudomonadota bacterium]